ncbi:hypothetical protein LPJ57_008117, partial [Coemansia sp. RSA 486]
MPAYKRGKKSRPSSAAETPLAQHEAKEGTEPLASFKESGITNLLSVAKPFKNPDYKSNRRWKNLKQVVAQEEQASDWPVDFPTHWNIDAAPSLLPQKKYCDLTGLPAKYTDPKTNVRYHSAEVYQLVKTLQPGSEQQYLALRNATTMHSVSAFRAVSRAATAGRMRTSVAPMIDVTDPCFLRLLRLISPFGNHQLWTEMVHANTFSRGQMHLDQTKLAHHIPVRELEDFAHGTVVQIGASDPDDAYAAVSELRQMGVRHVNLNCGCPSRNVQMGSFGAVLMTRPELAAQIVKSMLVAATESATENSPPAHISVKCRIGIDEDESPEFLRLFIDSIINATDSVAEASSAPVSFVLHARRAWLSGLSPEQNRSVPLLNHARAYEMARDYPHTQFVVNGGADSIQAVHDHLQN